MKQELPDSAAMANLYDKQTNSGMLRKYPALFERSTGWERPNLAVQVLSYSLRTIDVSAVSVLVVKSHNSMSLVHAYANKMRSITKRASGRRLHPNSADSRKKYGHHAFQRTRQHIDEASPFGPTVLRESFLVSTTMPIEPDGVNRPHPLCNQLSPDESPVDLAEAQEERCYDRR